MHPRQIFIAGQWGRPAMRVTYRDHDDDQAIARYMRGYAEQMMEAAGAVEQWSGHVAPQTGGSHLLGTCRMGDDPATSVVDKYNRSHDVSNLFICDGSSMVTSGRGQPTMTIMALSLSIFPFLVQQITASVFIQKNSALTLTTFLSIITLFFVFGVASIFNIYSVNKLSSKLGSDLRKAMFDKLLSLSTCHYNTLCKKKIADKFLSPNAVAKKLLSFTKKKSILINDLEEYFAQNTQLKYLDMGKMPKSLITREISYGVKLN
mgnify:CR=1 FL=1